MHKLTVLSIAALGVAAVACADPAADAPSAVVSPASAVASATSLAMSAAPAGAAKRTLTTLSGTVGFVGSKVTGSHDGSFPSFSGKIEIDGTDLLKSAVHVTIDMKSVVSDNDKLTGHLRTGDFFDVDNHPTATFHSSSIVAGGADGATHTVTGELTLRGVTKTIAFPATLAVSDAGVTAKAEFSINRKDFGVAYAGMPDDLINDLVLLKLDIRAS